jgi:signal transduction histidine kinase
MPAMAKSDPPSVSPSIKDVLAAATDYMNHSSYDSAQFVISAAFSQSETAVTETDLYYLHCYEAEVMYYNALFEQGLNSSLRSLELARKLANDTLVGNSENLIGLFLMNLGRKEEALGHLRSATLLLPSGHSNDYLAFQYHALGNLGECFMGLDLPDSALYYSSLSMPEAQRRGRNRGVALAYWNSAEAWLLKGDPHRARDYCLTGVALVQESPHRDVVQTLCTTLMKVYQVMNRTDSVYAWMDHGLVENANPLNTDFSRILFLQQATNTCILLADVKRGAGLLDELNALRQNISGKQQSQRIAILTDYYEKNQKLVLARELDIAQEKEIRLRKLMSVVLGVLALLLCILIFIIYKSFRQRQRIAQLQYKEQLQQAARELELNALQKRLEAVFAERNRIASDLHDDIGAALSSIRIYSGAAQKQFASNPSESLLLIQRINESSTGMMERMSDIVWSINPKNDSGQSLVLRMKTVASEVLGSMDIQVSYQIDEQVEDLHPSVIARRNIYLIYKEAINNIGKYSGATSAEVRLLISNGTLEMQVNDNGKGFNVQQAQHGNGLSNMSNRAKAIGAYFHISSHAGRGTQILLKVELAKISDTDNA